MFSCFNLYSQLMFLSQLYVLHSPKMFYNRIENLFLFLYYSLKCHLAFTLIVLTSMHPYHSVVMVTRQSILLARL